MYSKDVSTVTNLKDRQSNHYPSKSTEGNSFLALCKLASKENWCWSIVCTTCGHMHFRYAFKELANGKHPNKEGWIVNNRTRVTKEVVQIARSFSEQDQGILSRLVLDVPIEDIKKASKSPDWLGYLGLVTIYCNQHIKEIGSSWSHQFLDILPKTSKAHNAMLEISTGDRVLNLNDLELIEFALY